MDIHAKLGGLVGRHGLVRIGGDVAIGFTYLAVEPPEEIPAEFSERAFQNVLRQCFFQVRLDNRHAIDGAEVVRIRGRDILALQW